MKSVFTSTIYLSSSAAFVIQNILEPETLLGQLENVAHKLRTYKYLTQESQIRNLHFVH